MLKLIQKARCVGSTMGGRIDLLLRMTGVAVVSSLLAGCGAMGGQCSGVEMETGPGMLGQTEVTVRNTSAEPKLVTLAIVDSDGSEINSQTMRVDAKDIEETAVGNMRDGVEIKLTKCE